MLLQRNSVSGQREETCNSKAILSNTLELYTGHISSVIDLWTEFNEALKLNGDRAFCLSEDDKVILCELQKFLKPSHDLTELVSSEQPHLGLIPLVVKEVQDATKLDPYESEVISTLKTTVNNRVLASIELSFHRCNIMRDSRRGV